MTIRKLRERLNKMSSDWTKDANLFKEQLAQSKEWGLMQQRKALKLEAEIKELEEGATQQSEVYESEITSLEAENNKLKEDIAKCGLCFTEIKGYGCRCDNCSEKLGNEKLATIRKHVEDIVKGEGAYSRDHLKHAENCIENMKSIANEILDIIEKLEGGETGNRKGRLAKDGNHTRTTLDSCTPKPERKEVTK